MLSILIFLKCYRLITTESRPINIEFPFSITIDGEQIIINSEKDLDQSIKACHDFLSTQSESNHTFYCGFMDSEIIRWLQNGEDYLFLEECFNIYYPVTIISKESDDIKISNNEEFIKILESILNSIHYNYEEESIDFNYPIKVTLVKENRVVSINSGEEFIKIFKHCW